eukprot:284958-Pyramimonas_sp.AAC.1
MLPERLFWLYRPIRGFRGGRGAERLHSSHWVSTMLPRCSFLRAPRAACRHRLFRLAGRSTSSTRAA